MTEYDDLESKALDKLDSIQRAADENSQIIIGTLAVAFLASFFGIINPSIPTWWPLIPWMLVAAGVVAFVAGIYIYALIPEDEGILLVSLRADQDGGEIWELSEDEFDAMNTEGTLYQWDNSSRRVYEVRDYHPERNVAVANWREAEPASAVLKEKTPEDALEAVAELRKVYEPEAAEARRLKRRVRGIVRKLDRERTKARAKQLDQATGLDSIDSKSISDVLDDELPDDLHPEAGGGDSGDDRADGPPRTNGDTSQVDIDLSGDEPLTPEAQADGGEVKDE